MRIYCKTTTRLAVILFILTSLYLSYSHVRKKTNEEENFWLWDTLWSPQEVQTDRLSLNVSVSVLAGVLQQNKKFLTVGLCSVKRKKESYLLDTLQSVFSQSSQKELSEMVVVVHLADFDDNWVKDTVKSISDRFSQQLAQGHLLVIRVAQENYPPLTGLKRNFNDPPDRVTFRSKQNVDYAFLLHFSSSLSQYYIMIEDDVSCAKGFLTAIRHHIQSKGSSPWVTLEFSKLGYIGKLYHSEHLTLLSRFLYLFYQEMPCDFLLSHFRVLLMQSEVIRFKPSLFQHRGIYSSFQGTYNKLKDEDFVEELADNPPADVVTDITAYKDHSPNKAYDQGIEYFWGTSPINEGNFFMVVLHTPVKLSRILIKTGSEDKKDILSSAVVELGETVVRTEGSPKCFGFHKLGVLEGGRFEQRDISGTFHVPVSCLRIRVTDSQLDWVIIQNIQIWTEKQN
ncbi:alpha-1,3-mannosyl-glycoprotein 4-beta-N-acetylglucosaminyltransferase C [Chanos chanos]|uniref:Alpha-1,3-mannosyl-glycoprotein 4-beta-N-acetylglucosaminyltransferase C n=1 Tax=Chanos chanos TaxID=29144 RepID=A0A6J2UWH4_CHACN|nr:alpha-1,3-mannosyl-glycoprotein 4-beta-N-acetylglucosaminyltransferase C-like [Chanos chanos]